MARGPNDGGMATAVEQNYVYNVYSRLASHVPQGFFENARQRAWPNVAAFVRGLGPGSVLVDVGE